MIGPEDFEGLNGPQQEDALVCSSCGSDDVDYRDSRENGSMVGYCRNCEEYRDLLTDSEFLAKHPEHRVAS